MREVTQACDGSYSLLAVRLNKYNILIYSFALSLSGSDTPLSPNSLGKLMQTGVAARVAIGGWTTASGSHLPKPAFVQTVAHITLGIFSNTSSSFNEVECPFLLQELRVNPVWARICEIDTATVSSVAFLGARGNSSTDVSGFTEALDYTAIMN
ncbi:hypothetical protein JVU11DRAFT_7534 [Chiua virens]|nr:hypothetical protein JVU11DRAFT_7534 [Chiua virens]